MNMAEDLSWTSNRAPLAPTGGAILLHSHIPEGRSPTSQTKRCGGTSEFITAVSAWRLTPIHPSSGLLPLGRRFSRLRLTSNTLENSFSSRLSGCRTCPRPRLPVPPEELQQGCSAAENGTVKSAAPQIQTASRR